MTEEDKTTWIAGFWGRIGAFVIDIVILAALGFFLGLFLRDIFVALGNLGVLVGFSISLAYFGVMNSQVSNGQTLGKKALNIRVVDANNESISLARSSARCSVLCVPYFLGGALFGNNDAAQFWNLALNVVAIGGALAIAYLYVFNQTTRQSLHDLAVQTYVVKAEEITQCTDPFRKAHFGIVGAIFFLTALALYPANDDVLPEPIADLIQVRDLLEKDPIVISAVVSDGKSKRMSDEMKAIETTYVSAQILLKENQITDPIIARQFASILFAAYRPALDRDFIYVTLTYGYDIGIASYWRRQNHRFEPSDFQIPE